jgi:hypothetical protein
MPDSELGRVGVPRRTRLSRFDPTRPPSAATLPPSGEGCRKPRSPDERSDIRGRVTVSPHFAHASCGLRPTVAPAVQPRSPDERSDIRGRVTVSPHFAHASCGLRPTIAPAVQPRSPDERSDIRGRRPPHFAHASCGLRARSRRPFSRAARMSEAISGGASRRPRISLTLHAGYALDRAGRSAS